MTDKIKLYIDNVGRYVEADGGETLLDILARIRPELTFDPICARVNNKTEDLHFRIFSPKKVDFQPMWSASGERVYVRSLCMLLYRALTRVTPGAGLTIEHSISNGYYCLIRGVELTGELAGAIAAEMHRLVGLDLPIVPQQDLTSEAIPAFRKEGLEAKALLLETTHTLYTTYYTLDGIADRWGDYDLSGAVPVPLSHNL
ncbi:MAG: hypothetical protein K2J07_04150 [Muribaculaceae bacterium]|nr:hypothetical protein [Muribaculaceae bacterium]